MDQEQLVYQIALSRVKGVGPILAKNLVGYCNGVKEIFTEKKGHLSKIPGIGPFTLDQITSFNDFHSAEKEAEFIVRNNIKPLFFLDKEYPYRLKELPDAPILIFSRGSSQVSPEKAVAFIGTRKPSEAGKTLCRDFVNGLSSFGCTIVSGLAYGIDITAHRAALEAGLPTIGVLGHGLDRIYPALHKKTAMEMLENGGGLLTEFPSGTNPDYMNFPKRNRIVAGMVDAVVVVESGRKGGSMITAELAFHYNREVLAIPGKPGDELSSGCNLLIKQQKAHLMEDVSDLIQLLHYEQRISEPKKQVKLPLGLSAEQQLLLDLLKESGPLQLDEIMYRSGLGSAELALYLIELEFEGWVRALPGKTYELM